MHVYIFRFNCRDAVWWWLYSIKCYVESSEDGIGILKDSVSRLFPTDDSPAQDVGVCEQPLHDVMQESLNVHFQGLIFRERHAGRKIDEHMTDKGFNNQIGVHPDTGRFVMSIYFKYHKFLLETTVNYDIHFNLKKILNSVL